MSFPAPQFESIISSALCLLYGPTLTAVFDYWKTISLTIRTFVGKVLSVLFNTLSRIVVAFPSRSKCLLILWLQFVCSDFGAQENYGYYGMSIVSFWQKKNVIFSTQKTVVRDRPM